MNKWQTQIVRANAKVINKALKIDDANEEVKEIDHLTNFL